MDGNLAGQVKVSAETTTSSMGWNSQHGTEGFLCTKEPFKKRPKLLLCQWVGIANMEQKGFYVLKKILQKHQIKKHTVSCEVERDLMAGLIFL